jgi:hypothetical protein
VNLARDVSMDHVLAGQFLHTVKQGCERVLFRTHFKIFTDYEPVDRTIPWVPPRSAVNKKAEEALNNYIKQEKGEMPSNGELYDLLGKTNC